MHSLARCHTMAQALRNGRVTLNRRTRVKKLAGAGIYLLALAAGAVGLYELTAKSPTWLGQPLPGWQETRQVERQTRWNPPTGIRPVDRLLHEGEEAARFFGLLARDR